MHGFGIELMPASSTGRGQRLITTIQSACRLRCRRFVGVFALSVVFAAQAWAVEMAPINWSGSLGYNYRLLDGSGGQRSISQQGTGSLFANSYIWRPWFATADANVTLALDGSASTDETPGNAKTYNHSDSSILTGGLNLNVLPQSRAPSFGSAVSSERRP